MTPARPSVLLVCLPGGGAETSARTVARALHARGWSVALLVVSRTQPGIVQSVDGGVRQIVGRPGNLHYWIPKLAPGSSRWARVLRGYETALLVQKMAKQVAGAGEALIDSPEGLNFPTGSRRPYPVCVTLHSSSFAWKENLGAALTPADRCDKTAERRQLREAARVYAPSKAVALHAQRSLGLTLDRLDVFPLLVDEELLRRPASDSRSSEVYILHVGRPDLWKGAQYLIQAIPGIVQRCPNVSFVFAGWSASDKAVAELLADLPAGMADKHVRLLGYVPHDQVMRLYDKADICVVPSLWDNSPFVVYEAMARGCAVVASEVGGIPELVAEGENGLLVPPGDVTSLANAISSLASDRHRLMQLGRRSRERARELFDPGAIVQKQMAYYEEAWERHTAGNGRKGTCS